MKCDVCGEVWYDEDWYSENSYCRNCGVAKPRSRRSMIWGVMWVLGAVVLLIILVRAK
jgi:ribosomal protein L37E